MLAAYALVLAAPQLFGDGPGSDGVRLTVERLASMAMVTVDVVDKVMVEVLEVRTSLALMLAAIVLLFMGPALFPVSVACSTIISHGSRARGTALVAMFATPVLFVRRPYDVPISQSCVTIVRVLVWCRLRGRVTFVVRHYIAADPMVVVAPLSFLDRPLVTLGTARRAFKVLPTRFGPPECGEGGHQAGGRQAPK